MKVMQGRLQRRPVRLEDIAQRLGLTKMSVSKALRDHPDIPESTRGLVKATADSMGYLPNRFARSLSSAQSNVLGVVVPRISHAFFSNVLDAIEDAASARGYEILLTLSQEDPVREREHLRTLLSMRVDGLLVSSCMTTDAHTDVYRQVERLGIPLVFFDRCHDPMSFATVTCDDARGAHDAVLLALEKGFRRIAHLAGDSGVNIGRDRHQGYLAGLRDRGMPVDASLIVRGGFDEKAGYDGMRKLLDLPESPDAVLCVTFPVAVGAIDAMRACAPGRLHDTLFMFFGVPGLNRFLNVPYVCADQGAAEIGREAVNLVVAGIRGEAGEAHRIVRITLSTSDDSETPPYVARTAD